MCGIIGIISNQPVSNRLVEGLSRLEYRGYDSAGIAILEDNSIVRLRAEGKLVSLRGHVDAKALSGTIGIGHTRWATHGAPNTQNAHPQATDRVALVHNGIIENYQDLKKDLIASGLNFESETDTEVIVHLIDQLLAKGRCPEEAVSETLLKLKGAFALGIVFKEFPDLLIGARQGSPLVMGVTQNELYLGSDAWALAPWTQKICYLEEGDMVIMRKSSREDQPYAFEIFNSSKPVTRAVRHLELDKNAVTKAGYRHYMLKEIFEQPKTIQETLYSVIDQEKLQSSINVPIDFSSKNLRLRLIACGSSYYASMMAKYWFETYARILCEVDLASEFRYRNPVLTEDDLCIFISQSGETSDTLAALALAKTKGCTTLVIVNVPESSMVRAADHHILTLAGPEISVASTKAFTAQLAVLCALALHAAQNRQTQNKNQLASAFQSLLEIPKNISETLQDLTTFDQLGLRLSQTRDVLFIGRGTNYPVALEGALKLKELSYIHAEAYAAGELKHGPIALVDKHTPLIAINPNDAWYEKTSSNIQEVASRGAPIIVLTDDASFSATCNEFHKILLPKTSSMTTCFVTTVVMQCISYYTALHKGTDVDQPRNLAKSVTVE